MWFCKKKDENLVVYALFMRKKHQVLPLILPSNFIIVLGAVKEVVQLNF